MENTELLERIKTSLGITGDYQDGTLLFYIEEVKNYMLDAGVPQEIVDSSRAIGVVSRGVSDLWNYGSGSTTLSPYFKERVIQLRAGE